MPIARQRPTPSNRPVRTAPKLSSMTIPSQTARQLCAAADEALTEAAFRTGEFTGAERLLGEARTLAEQEGDRAAEALAVGGLGMALHYRNIAKLIGGITPADADVAAEEELMRRALTICEEIGDPASTARALFGVGLVFQVLRRDWGAAMPLPCRGRPSARGGAAAELFARLAGKDRRSEADPERPGRAGRGRDGRREPSACGRTAEPGRGACPPGWPAALADPRRRAESSSGRGGLGRLGGGNLAPGPPGPRCRTSWVW